MTFYDSLWHNLEPNLKSTIFDFKVLGKILVFKRFSIKAIKEFTLQFTRFGDSESLVKIVQCRLLLFVLCLPVVRPTIVSHILGVLFEQ